MVVLGGGSLLGGRLSYGLTLVGAITLQAIKTGILLAGFPPQMGLILMAVMVSVLLVVQAPALRNGCNVERFGRLRRDRPEHRTLLVTVVVLAVLFGFCACNSRSFFRRG